MSTIRDERLAMAEGNDRPEPKSNSKAVEARVQEAMRRHREHSQQPVTDEDVERMREGWRRQYGFDLTPRNLGLEVPGFHP
jgi:hypothetical protein